MADNARDRSGHVMSDLVDVLGRRRTEAAADEIRTVDEQGQGASGDSGETGHGPGRADDDSLEEREDGKEADHVTKPEIWPRGKHEHMAEREQRQGDTDTGVWPACGPLRLPAYQEKANGNKCGQQHEGAHVELDPKEVD